MVVADLRNLTGDARLDDSLEQAFRISLEQSNYVNLLSDLKVRETLQHMQRKPDVQVDRALGAEIALRDGARALLLPTVAEVGGRLRVSVEVVDPRTQTTVYAVSADGKGIESALASIDQVTDGLREKLGEALQSVQKTSVPLPNVSTPSLDALKAFAVARNVMDTNRDRPTAFGLYQRALHLDPQFALAYADMARAHAALGEVAQAKDAWRKALAIPQRLSPQEKLRIELLLRQYDAPQPYFQQVDQYLTLYPDDYQVIGRAGTTLWHQRNDFRASETHFRRALKQEYPRHGVTNYSLAVVLLGQERYEEALAVFRKAREQGYTGSGEYYARAFDARRRHDEADRVFAQGANGRGGWQGEGAVVTWLDRGQWTRAADAAQAWRKQASAADDAVERMRAEAAAASVQAIVQAPDARKRLHALLSRVDADAREVDAIVPGMSAEIRLLAGLLAARIDDRELVRIALQRVRGQEEVGDFPVVAELQQVVLAEQERLLGKPQAAATRLRSLARRDTALVMTHWGLMRAERAAGNKDAAQAQAHWLASHRGRVLTESTASDVLRFMNASASNEALLEQAELLSQEGQKQEARRQLDAFLAAWSRGGLPDGYRRRVDRLQAALLG